MGMAPYYHCLKCSVGSFGKGSSKDSAEFGLKMGMSYKAILTMGSVKGLESSFTMDRRSIRQIIQRFLFINMNILFKVKTLIILDYASQ